MPEKAEIGATKDSPVYRVRVPIKLATQWEDYCQKNNQKSPALIRELMHEKIQSQESSKPKQPQTQKAQPDNGSKKRIEVRLTPSEHQSITTQAEAENCSPQHWVINCVRASLTQEPQFTMATTKALCDSSYQLRAIGRNLNQIAKQMNQGDYEEITTQYIKQLTDHIYQHTDQVAKLTDASISRWVISNEKN